MPAAVGTAVVGWVGAAGASAGIATAAGAVASAVVTGAIVGAVVGAGVAIVTGEDPLKAALKGALIGGVSGGLMKGVGMAMSSATEAGTSAATNTSTSVAQTMDESARQLATNSSAATNTIGQTTEQPGLLQKSWDFVTGGGNNENLSDVEKLAKSNIKAGIGQGVFEGIANVGAAKMSGDEAQELAEWKEKQIALNRANNRPGDFNASDISLSLPDRWGANLKKKGLLA